MTQTIKAIDLIRRSMYLINAASAGEMPSTLDLNDALITLNEMLDTWSLQPLAVYGITNEDWILTPGKFEYEWGITAVAPDLTSERPVFVEDITCTWNNVTTPVKIITQSEYDAIGYKSTEQVLTERAVYVNSFPLGRLILFPVPTEAVTLSISVTRQMTSIPNLQATIALPPGYQKALRYNLAVELWPEYQNPTTDIESVKRMARDTLGKIKIANSQTPEMRFDHVPTIDLVGRSWDWRMQ